MNRSQEFFHSMLSGLSQKDEPSGTCPDPEQMAAFLEGRLHGKERSKIMAYYNICPSCRRQWLLVETAMEEVNVQAKPWFDRVIERIKKIHTRHAFAGDGLGLALAACLLLILHVPQKSNLSRMISDYYASMSPEDIARFNCFRANSGDGESQSNQSKTFLVYKAILAAGHQAAGHIYCLSHGNS